MKRSRTFTLSQGFFSPLLMFVALLTSNTISAIDFGIYDPRTLAMGGAAVASASSESAIFYNPALLALYDGQEEDTRNGRVVFPTAVLQATTSAPDILKEDTGERLDEAISAFNAVANATTGAEATAALTNLRQLIEDNKSQNILADAFVGIAISEPADRTGGSFYYGEHVIVGGSSVITESDLDLLIDYIELIEFLTPGGAPGVDHPNLRDDAGNLLDPAGQITSQANINGLRVREIGLALAREFKFMNMPTAFGITPKFVFLDAYSDIISYGDSTIDLDNDRRSHLTFNADFGLAVQVNPYLKFALATKDLIPKTLETGSGFEIKTKARTRVGASLDYRYLTISADIDLQENIPLGQTAAVREAHFGIEFRPISILRVRGGLRQELNQTRDNIISAGIGLKLGRLMIEASAANNEEYLGGSVIVAWAF